MVFGLLLVALCVPSGQAEAAEAPQPLFQRCDGGPADLSCNIPRGIGVNPTNGNLYLADQAHDRIVEYSPWGGFIRAFGWGVADGSPEAQVCTVVADCHNGIRGAGTGQLTRPQGVAVDVAGNVYVAEGDFSNRRVQKFDSEGHFLFMIGGAVNKTAAETLGRESEANLCPAPGHPADVCQGATEGTATGQFGPWVEGSFIATGTSPNNLLYVGDKGRVQVFNSNGTYKENFPDPEGVIAAGGSVQSLATAPSAGLYLAFKEKPNVTRLTSAGKSSVSPGCTASVAKPTALASAQTTTGVATGSLYVYDEASGQTRQFSSACKETGTPFAKGEITRSTGLAAATACLSSGADIYLSNSVTAETASAFIRAYGPAPDKPTCPKPALAPEIASQYTVSAGTTEAQLRAQINPRYYTDTTYLLQYGTRECIESEGFEGACARSQPAAPALLGAPATDFPATTPEVFLTGLTPASAYRYRFAAQSSGGGPVYGPQRSFTTYALPSAAACPNDALRSGPSAALPDCRAYEMVSPVDKEGGDVITNIDPTGVKAQRDQSAADGSRFTYSSYRAFADPQSAPYTSQYLASRTPAGWSSENISPPRGVEFSFPGSTTASDSGYSEFQAFSDDLCSGWLAGESGTAPPPDPSAAPFNFNLYRRSNCGPGAGGYQALSKLVDFSTFAPLQGLSADGEVALFANQAHLTQDLPLSPALTTEMGTTNNLACFSPTTLKAISYQWLRDGVPIAGASGEQYAVNPAADAGHTIQCRMSATEAGTGTTQVANPAWVIAPYPTTAPPLAPSSIPAPDSSAALEVGGPAGQALSCDPGTWQGSPSFAYQWYRNGAPLSGNGAETATYTVQAADLATAATFQCEVRATNAGATVAATSAALDTDPAPQAPVARPNMAFRTAQVLYVRDGAGTLHAVCALPGGLQSNSCSAGSKGIGVDNGRRNLLAGALSADGSRLFWTSLISGGPGTGGRGKLFLRQNPAQPQSALALGQASGAGQRSAGSPEVTALTTASGAFAPGQSVSGAGVPFGTTILSVGAGTLTLSANATETKAAGTPLEADSECTEAARACTFAVSAAAETSASENASLFWAASTDGSTALFGNGENTEDLYLFDSATATPTLIAHKTLGVLGQSSDLARVYFLSSEALTGAGEPNSEGAVAQAGQPNLYLRRAGGAFSFIATLSRGEANSEATHMTPVNVRPEYHAAHVSADGESLIFLSTATPTGYDNLNQQSGDADAELYLYRAASGQLVCASCPPSSARPSADRNISDDAEPYWAAAKLPNVENDLHPQTVLSENGRRLFFESFSPLVSADTNGKEDVYEWEAAGNGRCGAKSPSFSPLNEGCVDLISAGTAATDSELLDASADGSDVFIRTGSSLVPSDPGSVDVYDARVEGGFPQPTKALACEGEACQGPYTPPNDPTPASSGFEGAGNVVEAPAKNKKHRHHHKRHRRHRHRGGN